ncbi:hypothetical protein JCM10213_009270 [Rhodosporidiobolus nylandii]
MKTPRVVQRTWQTASFHFSLTMTFVTIAAVWAITPLSWGYVLWTAFSQLGPASRRPAPPGSARAFTVLHYVTLAYTSLEVLFSIYYRYLAFRAQKLRQSPRHSRKFLRGLILRALENGLDVEEELEEEEHERERAHKKAVSSSSGEEKNSPRLVRVRKLRRGGQRRRLTGGRGGPDADDKALGDEEWQERARDEEEAARGSDGELSLPPWKRIRRRGQNTSGDGALTPELGTTDLPAETGKGDYLSARQLPTLLTGDMQHPLQPAPSRASMDSRDEGYGGGGHASTSRISLHTLDSAIATSPRSVTAPHLPKPSSLAGTYNLPYHPLLRVRLTPTDPRALDFRATFVRWFGGSAKWEDLKKQNVADWFAWSLYGSPLEQLESERKEWDKAGRPALFCADGVTPDNDSDLESEDGEAAEECRRAPAPEGDKLGLVQHCVALIEARSAWRFPPGRNPRVQATRLTLDPVRVASRPLLLYGVVSALQNGVVARAKAKGFREVWDDETRTRYLVYVPKGWEPKREPEERERPLVFLHGLGMGMAQYATLLSVLCTSPSLRTRPILVLLQPHISMSFFARGYLDPPDQKRCTQGLEKALRKHRFDERAGGCTVLSHSNGTIVHGWLLKDHPSLVARSCLVDPVCFALWEPWVCHNFLVRKPEKAIEHLMRYFVSRELGVALMLSRTFEWTANLLFPSQIPNNSSAHKTAIFLSSEDSILDARRVSAYLRRNGLRQVRGAERVGERAGGGGLKVFEGLKHGESMIGEGEPFESVMAWVTWDERYATAYTSSEGETSSPAGEESA